MCVARAKEKKERKGRENWSGWGRRDCHDEVEVWRDSGSVSISQPTSVRNLRSTTARRPLLYARVSISFPTASTLDESSRITAGRDSTAQVLERSGAQPLGRSLEAHHPSFPIAIPLGPSTCRRQADRQTDGLDCSALCPSSHLCRCMGFDVLTTREPHDLHTPK